MLRAAIATVMVSDFEASVHFYRDTLGLTEKVRHGDDWAEYTTPDGFVIALHSRREDTPPAAGGGISIGFDVGEIRGARAALEQRGVEFRGPTIDNPRVRLAFFADPDGHPLYLSEHVPWGPDGAVAATRR